MLGMTVLMTFKLFCVICDGPGYLPLKWNKGDSGEGYIVYYVYMYVCYRYNIYVVICNTIPEQTHYQLLYCR